MKLSQQHYLDQLPAAEEEQAAPQESTSSLHVVWEQDGGAQTAVITGGADLYTCQHYTQQHQSGNYAMEQLQF